MTERLDRAGLQVDAVLARFVEGEALPGSGIDAAQFWSGFAGLLADLRRRTARFWPSGMSCRPRSTPGTSPARPAA
jgi:hypothetical protein